MKRILFVDDEPLLLEVIEARLGERTGSWEMDFAGGGDRALKLMFKKPYDVIVADMRMPEMDGIELLTLVMQRHPNTTRIMMSGQSSRDQTLRLVGTAHQYISKPCNLDDLECAIDQALDQREILTNESLKKLVSQMQSLPSIPSLYLELVEELQKDDPALDKMSEIISRDLGMCSKMLQLVNSAFFGLPRKIANTEEAVGYLGVDTVKALVLYLHIFSLYERVKINNFSFDRLWSHSWTVGVAARKMAHHEGLSRETTDNVFIAGLLHDVGKLVLVTGVPTSCQIAIDKSENEHLLMHEAEKTVLWGLPQEIIDAVGGHHNPGAGDAEGITPATLIHVANWIDHRSSPSLSEAASSLLDEPYLERSGLLEKVDEWAELVATDREAGHG